MPLKLHNYQKEAVNFIDSTPEGALWGDMGIGKTIICLSSIVRLLTDFEIKGVLIVAPLRVARLTWPLEIEEWEEFSWMNYTLLHGDHKDDRLKQKTPIYLINYEGLLWLEKKLVKINHKRWPFDMIIWDELTRMKSHSSMRFKKWKKFIKCFKRKIGLTGTPMANGYLELWAQFFVLDKGDTLGRTYTGYKERFFYQADYHGYDFKPRSGAKEIIQNLIAPKTLRIAAEGNLDMPPLTIEDVYLSLSAKLSKKYSELEEELFTELEKGKEVSAVNAAVLSNKCLQFAGGSIYIEDENLGVRYTQYIHDIKIRAFKNLVKKLGKPVLVAYSFQHERDVILKHFPEAVVLKSGYSQEKEMQIQKDWNAGKISMLVCHPASAGHGLNLQKGSSVGIWYSLNWSLELYQQLIARLWRQGQKEAVTFFRFIMNDTVDEAVSTALDRKDRNQGALLKALLKYRERK